MLCSLMLTGYALRNNRYDTKFQMVRYMYQYLFMSDDVDFKCRAKAKVDGSGDRPPKEKCQIIGARGYPMMVKEL